MGSELKRHMRAAHKEMLLALRSFVDAAIKCLEKPVVEKAAQEPEEEVGDNLTLIRGIGPQMQARLYGAGVTTYAQLAQLTPKELEKIAGRSATRITKEEWISQALKAGQIT